MAGWPARPTGCARVDVHAVYRQHNAYSFKHHKHRCIAAAAYSVVVHEFRTCELWPSLCPSEKLLFIHPYPLQGILILSGLGLVFRVNRETHDGYYVSPAAAERQRREAQGIGKGHLRHVNLQKEVGGRLRAARRPHARRGNTVRAPRVPSVPRAAPATTQGCRRSVAT